MLDNIYILVLKDSFFSNLFITLNYEFAYPAMLLFGKHDRIMATAAALVGSTAGLVVSYFLFVILAHLMRKQLNSNPGFPAAKHYIDKFSPLIGSVTALSEFAFIPTFFFGVTGLKFRKYILIIVFYRAVYYAYMLYTTHALFQ